MFSQSSLCLSHCFLFIERWQTQSCVFMRREHLAGANCSMSPTKTTASLPLSSCQCQYYGTDVTGGGRVWRPAISARCISTSGECFFSQESVQSDRGWVVAQLWLVLMSWLLKFYCCCCSCWYTRVFHDLHLNCSETTFLNLGHFSWSCVILPTRCHRSQFHIFLTFQSTVLSHLFLPQRILLFVIEFTLLV